jgi:hypothetical protein
MMRMLLGWETMVVMAAAGLALVLTPVFIWLLAKGVKSLSDIRDLFKRPPGDYGDDTAPGRSEG